MFYASLFLLSISVIFCFFTLATYIPEIPFLSDYSNIATSFFSGYLLLVSLFIFIVSLCLFLYKMNLLHSVILGVSLINVLGVSIPIYRVFRFSNEVGTSISLFKNLDIHLNRAKPNIGKSIVYYEIDEQKLSMDITPAQYQTGKSKPLVLIHGGGFVSGNRGEEPVWTEYFSQRGYTVFDVGYRLATSELHTYNIAAREINTALSFIDRNQEKYNLNMAELTLLGSSAGASLALQAGYGGSDIFPSFINEDIPKIKKIIALFPATDLGTLWNQNTQFIGINSRDVGKKYIGGGPEQFPEEHDMVNIAKLATQNAPETLVIHGLRDTLIPEETLNPFKNRLGELNIPHRFVYIPYAVHGFTYFENTLSFQITRQLVDSFLDIQKK